MLRVVEIEMSSGKLHRLGALVIFVSILPSLCAAQRRVAVGPGIDSQRLSIIPGRLRQFVDEGSMAGAVVLVARRGQVVMLEAVGYQDLEARKPMRTDTIFDIRSLTKPITAIGIMILVEDGKLALNDPVEKYLPEFRGTANQNFRKISIHHLLTHTAALPLYRLPESETMPIRRDRTLRDYVALLSNQKPEYEPGTKFRYSSGGFAILGRIIELVSGKPFEVFMKERVFVPLGMKDSSFYVPAEKQHRLAALYRLRDNRLERWQEIEQHAKVAKYPGPEFGMYSTASDLAAVSQMMLNGGTYRGERILSPLSVDVMTANHTLNLESVMTGRPGYQGLGWGIYGDLFSAFPLTTPGSFGHNGAFGSIVWIDPERELVRIFLQHRFGAGNESNLFMAMAGAAVVN